jgi:acetyltransferase-like isoleucine patch superfamily enzyme
MGWARMLTTKPRFPVREIVLFGLLPSFLKKIVYRLRGYRIGRGVSLGIGSVIQGEDVQLGDNVSIGFFTIVRGRKIRIDAHVQIGALTFLDTPNLELGEGTKINEQVFVGGLQFPDSRLVVGRNCQIMQMTFINPTRSITIGDDSGIGGDCLLFGHSSWLSQFEGYPIEFDSIEIGKSVSLAWRVFVLPGTKILDGAVIGANSLVRGEVPARCLAVGFPARVVAKAPEFPRPVSDDDKRQILLNIRKEFVNHLTDAEFICREEGSVLMVQEPPSRRWFRRARSWRMTVLSKETLATKHAGVDVLVGLYSLSNEERAVLTASGTMWIDLEKKERPDGSNALGEEFVQYLKRYGVRLFRV